MPQSQHQGTAEVEIEYLRRTGISWQSRSKTTVGAPAGATTLHQDDVTLLSVMARYQITPTVSVQFNSDNLLDEKYFVLDEYDNTCYGTPVDYSLSINVKLSCSVRRGRPHHRSIVGSGCCAVVVVAASAC